MKTFTMYQCEKCGELFSEQNNAKAKAACLAHEEKHKTPVKVLEYDIYYNKIEKNPEKIKVEMDDGSVYEYLSREYVERAYL